MTLPCAPSSCDGSALIEALRGVVNKPPPLLVVVACHDDIVSAMLSLPYRYVLYMLLEYDEHI